MRIHHISRTRGGDGTPTADSSERRWSTWTEPLNVETGPRYVITDDVATNTTRTATITGVVLLVIAGMVAFLSTQRRR